MAKHIVYSKSKTLKLYKTISKKVNANIRADYERTIYQLENQIKLKGAKSIGPLIQHTSSRINNEGHQDVIIRLVRQIEGEISRVEKSFELRKKISFEDCLYVKYTGVENKLKHAYDRVSLEAFQNDIELTGDFYTVFLGQKGLNIEADVFAIKKK